MLTPIIPSLHSYCWQKENKEHIAQRAAIEKEMIFPLVVG
jgi:hypothetical protein